MCSDNGEFEGGRVCMWGAVGSTALRVLKYNMDTMDLRFPCVVTLHKGKDEPLEYDRCRCMRP